jgi:hypothetical protein
MRNLFLHLTRSEVERYFVEPRASFLIHSTILEAYTLRNDPITQCRVFLLLVWSTTCNSDRDRWSVGGGIQDEGKTINSPNQVTVTMFYKMSGTENPKYPRPPSPSPWEWNRNQIRRAYFFVPDPLCHFWSVYSACWPKDPNTCVALYLQFREKVRWNVSEGIQDLMEEPLECNRSTRYKFVRPVLGKLNRLSCSIICTLEVIPLGKGFQKNKRSQLSMRRATSVIWSSRAFCISRSVAQFNDAWRCRCRWSFCLPVASELAIVANTVHSPSSLIRWAFLLFDKTTKMSRTMWLASEQLSVSLASKLGGADKSVSITRRFAVQTFVHRSMPVFVHRFLNSWSIAVLQCLSQG